MNYEELINEISEKKYTYDCACVELEDLYTDILTRIVHDNHDEILLNTICSIMVFDDNADITYDVPEAMKIDSNGELYIITSRDKYMFFSDLPIIDMTMLYDEVVKEYIDMDTED